MVKKRIKSEDYDPNGLIDFLIEEKQLKNDAALCRLLGLAPPMVSKIRKQILPVTGDTLLRMRDLTGIDIDTLRERANIPKYDDTNKVYPKEDESCSVG